MGQYTLELIVREMMLHPESCLQTRNPEKAKLFYVPYLPSMEFHQGRLFVADYSTSPYGQAIYDALEGNYQGWEDYFGFTSKYWQRRNGSDHILVWSEPLHGYSHPKMKRGNHHYIKTQRLLRPAIGIVVEVSTTFVQMNPKCAAKNVLTFCRHSPSAIGIGKPRGAVLAAVAASTMTNKLTGTSQDKR